MPHLIIDLNRLVPVLDSAFFPQPTAVPFHRLPCPTNDLGDLIPWNVCLIQQRDLRRDFVP
jgi:hypothetical protein